MEKKNYKFKVMARQIRAAGIAHMGFTESNIYKVYNVRHTKTDIRFLVANDKGVFVEVSSCGFTPAENE